MSLKKKRCDNCGGPFGLIRQRNGTRQFCSRKCLSAFYHRLVDAIRRQGRASADAADHAARRS